MFIPIDYEQWDRKEIYDAFHGYLYCMTVELDITEFLKKIHENHWKFYPRQQRRRNRGYPGNYRKIRVYSGTGL